MFEPALFGIFLHGASKSDLKENILHYKDINYKIICLFNLEIYLGTLIWCKNLTLKSIECILTHLSTLSQGHCKCKLPN